MRCACNLTETTFAYISRNSTLVYTINIITWQTITIHTYTSTYTRKDTCARIRKPSPTEIRITVSELPILSPFESFFLSRLFLPPPPPAPHAILTYTGISPSCRPGNPPTTTYSTPPSSPACLPTPHFPPNAIYQYVDHLPVDPPPQPATHHRYFTFL